MNYIIENGDIYTPTEIVECGSLIIRNGRIDDILPYDSVGLINHNHESFTRIDAHRSVVVPGFVDLHVHGGGGADITDESPDDLEKMVNLHLKNGTTSQILTTFSGTTPDELKQQVKRIGQAKEFNEAIRGIHLEGPFLNPNYCGMYPAESFMLPDEDFLKKLVELSDDSIRMITIAPELKGALDIISYCAQNDIISALGHSEADYELVMKSITLGLSTVTHIFNAMPQLHHRRPGAIGAALMDDRLSVQLISDGIHLHPLIIKMIIQLKGFHDVCLITDAMRAAGMPDGDYKLGRMGTVHLEGGCVRADDGTLASTPLTMLQSLRNILGFGDASFLKAVHMVSTTPARVIGMGEYIGSIKKGYDADIVVINRDLNIDYVFLKGERVV